MKRFNSLIALILVSNLLFSDVMDLASTQLSASSPYYESNNSSTIAINNPALTADIQRYTFDLSYLLLSGITNPDIGFGHSISLGGALPSKYGVISSVVDVLLTDGLNDSELNIGNGAAINLNFSKEIYSDLYFGMGVTSLLGSDDDGFDWGLGLNIGFVKNSGDLTSLLNDFRWGASLNNLGKGYKNDNLLDATSSYPAFTPTGFIEFSPYSSENINVNIASEISFPSLTDLNLEIGAKSIFFKNFILDTSMNVNVRELVDGNLDSLIPSLFIGYDLNLGKDTTQISLSANPYAKGIWAIGASGTMPLGSKDTNPPEVNIVYNETQYISPNFDGIKDELTFPVEVTDERYLAGYEITIRDSYGRIVKNIVNKDERPENESFKNLFSKLISKKTGIPIPESFRWDGKKDDGDLVPDGEYNFITKFTDDNGNLTITPKKVFVVDNTAPMLEIQKPTGLDLIFSPNGDGNKDNLIIPQSGSKEVRWYAEVLDFLNNPVKSFAWDNEFIDDFKWDGKDDSGQLVPDGVYKYKVTSTDLAGNKIEGEVDNIIINTKQPPIGITIDTNSFSPNGDNVKDFMEFLLSIPVKTGILEWRLQIKDRTGSIVNEFSTKKQGYSVIEDNIRFDGKDLSGRILEEGKYTAELSVTYQNGHSPKVTSPEFVIDNTAPKATIKAKYTMFSPNGDLSKDQIIFEQSSSLEEEWNGVIYDEFGTSVYNIKWKGAIPKEFAWNGKKDDGKLLENGKYSYVLSSTDKSGNSYKGSENIFFLNNSNTTIELVLNKDSFSPKDLKDFIELKALVNSTVPISTYSLDILDTNNKVIRNISTNQNIDNSYIWDGKNNSGNGVVDSIYYGRIIGEFENGNKVNVLTPPINLDTKKPEVVVKLKDKYSIFSPNGDGQKDYLTFTQTTSNEDEWIGEILNSKNEVVFLNKWSGIAPKEFVFTGKDKNNLNLPDGKYSYTLKSVDKAGNIGTSGSLFVDIDTEDVDLFVSTNNTHFSPNNDGVKDSIDFIPKIKKIDGIDSLNYSVLNKNNLVVYSKDLTTDFSNKITWNGKDSKGKTLADDEYTLKLTVNYKRGDSPIATTNLVIDTVAPIAEISTNNLVFSPNGDGNKDLVEISNISKDIAEWNLLIKSSDNLVIKEANINGQIPKEWNFDGRGSDLKVLKNGKYIYTVKGTDKAGNIFQSKNYTLELDNSTSTVLVSNDYEVFSPNNDKVKDFITFTTKIDSGSSVESWSFKILDEKNAVVKEVTGNTLPKDIVWDGFVGNSKTKASDGKYKGVISVIHGNGNNPISTTPQFILDTQYPEINLTVKNQLFSPNNDGLKDSVILEQSGSGEELYHGVILNSKNELVKEWYWKKSIDTLFWDGKDSSGNISKDGIYSYSVDVTDLGGNKTVKSIKNIEIDTLATDIFITYKKPVFAPDLSSTLGGQIFGLIVNNTKGIESWKISILDDNNEIVKDILGSGPIPSTLEWDGKDKNNRNTNGTFTADFKVVYLKGNSPVYSTKSFLADSEAPLIKVSTSPTPFSPDDDYVDDELSIELGVKDLSNIENWTFEIKDPKGNDFISFSGEGKPGKKIIWDGKSSKGELVQAAEEYTYIMKVKDAAGHIGEATGEIPVDVLVIKEGDKLKIKVSSIIFEPNSSVLDFTGSNGDSNKRILKRLSEILNKYSSYKIIIEGHAHNIYGDKITSGQRKSMVDFSNERAIEVKNSLIKLGISSGRMTTVGIGGNSPLINENDYENIWKNRRVEFVLVK